jgi:hypothetical protein
LLYVAKTTALGIELRDKCNVIDEERAREFSASMRKLDDEVDSSAPARMVLRYQI